MLRNLFSLFPAYAGVIPIQAINTASFIPFPRIRGGDPMSKRNKDIALDFSPHTRG